MVSDIDEIPNPEKFDEMKRILKKENIVQFNQKLFYYYLNGISSQKWIGTRATTYRKFRLNFLGRANLVRRIRDIKTRLMGIKTIKNGGWHFSYLGGKEKVKEKIRAFAHTELNPEEIVNQGEGSFRGEKITYIKINDFFPKEIVKNKERYKEMIR